MNFVDTFIQDVEHDKRVGTDPNYTYRLRHEGAVELVEEIRSLRKELGPDFKWGDRVVFESPYGPSKRGIFIDLLEHSNRTSWVVLEGSNKFSPVPITELRKEEE